MLVPDNQKWLQILFSLHPSSALKHALPRILTVVVVAVFITWAELDSKWITLDLTPLPFSLIGLALSIFLGFRNNTSYDRFWEGRKLWGRVVNDSRSFARQATLYVDDAEEDVAKMVRGVAGYVHVLRQHLRGEPVGAGLEHLLPGELLATLPGSTNPPQRVLAFVTHQLAWLYRAGRLHQIHLVELEETLDRLTDHQGGCERIKATPIPFTYTILIHRLTAVYCFTLPLGIVADVGALTPVVTAIVSYAFFGLDDLGSEIEDPFGMDPADLPLMSICNNIERNLMEHIGGDVPAKVQAENGVLM